MSYSPGSRYAPCVEREDGPASRATKYRSAKRRDHREAMRDAMAELLLIADERREIEYHDETLDHFGDDWGEYDSDDDSFDYEDGPYDGGAYVDYDDYDPYEDEY